MVNTLLLLWSMLATAAVFVGGLLLTIFPYGGRWAGIVMVVLSVALGYTCVELAREEWGWRRRRAVIRAQYPRRTSVRRAYSASMSPPRDTQHPVNANEQSARRQEPATSPEHDRHAAEQPSPVHT